MENIKALVTLVWRYIITPSLYLVFMWACLVAALTLVFGDPLRAAGIVSALTLFYIIQANFNKEFYGSRVPNGIQKQTKG